MVTDFPSGIDFLTCPGQAKQRVDLDTMQVVTKMSEMDATTMAGDVN